MSLKKKYNRNSIVEINLGLEFDKPFSPNEIESLKSSIIDPLGLLNVAQAFQSVTIHANADSKNKNISTINKGYSIESNNKKYTLLAHGTFVSFNQKGQYSSFIDFLKKFQDSISTIKRLFNYKTIKNFSIRKSNLFDLEIDKPLTDYFNHICPIQQNGIFFENKTRLDIIFNSIINNNQFNLRILQNSIDSGKISLIIYGTKFVNTPLENFRFDSNNLNEINDTINSIFESTITDKLKNLLS